MSLRYTSWKQKSIWEIETFARINLQLNFTHISNRSEAVKVKQRKIYQTKDVAQVPTVNIVELVLLRRRHAPSTVSRDEFSFICLQHDCKISRLTLFSNQRISAIATRLKPACSETRYLYNKTERRSDLMTSRSPRRDEILSTQPFDDFRSRKKETKIFQSIFAINISDRCMN